MTPRSAGPRACELAGVSTVKGERREMLRFGQFRQAVGIVRIASSRDDEARAFLLANHLVEVALHAVGELVGECALDFAAA